MTAIKKLNGITYTGVLGTDYIIENLRKVTFKQIAEYLTGFWWDSIEFIYTAGFSTIPSDIKMAELMIASSMHATRGANNSYSAYQIGDERVTFKSKTDADDVMRLLKPYRTF